jgi:hypothetical protein
MLVNDFFTISKLEKMDLKLRLSWLLMPIIKYLKGIFRTSRCAGVCMMQMVKEIIEKVIGEKTNLVRAGEMKFLAIIDPKENNMIWATLKYNIEKTAIWLCRLHFLKSHLSILNLKDCLLLSTAFLTAGILYFAVS